MNGLAVLGEMDKAVPVSVQRFSEISESNEGVLIRINGVVGETVNIAVAD